jgi:hypothetical protein
MNNKRVYVIGGGTFSHVRNHLAIAAPAFGTTARRIAELCKEHSDTMDIQLCLTKMADPGSSIVTNHDLEEAASVIVADPLAKIVFFTSAVCDFEPDEMTTWPANDPRLTQWAGNTFGKDEGRLSSSMGVELTLKSAPKIIGNFRYKEGGRKDLFLVGFKTTCGATPEEQYNAGLELLKKNSCNLVLANDVKTRLNMVICPEEAVYHETTDREEALRGLVEMTYLRSHLTFTRSTVVAGEPVAWDSELIYPVLRDIVDYCINRGAYKKFLGVTAGHFAAKLSETDFITSRRKTDFNDMKNVGLVKVRTDGPDSVIAYGSKPSVGGQSQRIVFSQHPEYDCIVHFHCPIKPGSEVPVASQREFECGSHQCGANTSRNLKRFGNLSAVYLGQHGPNIVFHHDINPQEVIDFIEANFDLEQKTGGYMVGKELAAV